MNNGFNQAPVDNQQGALWNGSPRPNEYVNTNVSLVTSLEEALIKSTVRGSDTVHFHQSKDVFYRIRVDWDGRKYWKELAYHDAQSKIEQEYITRNEFQQLVDRVNMMQSAPVLGGQTDV